MPFGKRTYKKDIIQCNHFHRRWQPKKMNIEWLLLPLKNDDYIRLPDCSTFFSFRGGIDDPIEISTKNGNNNQLDTVVESVKLLIHGWNADAEHVALEPVRNAYIRNNSSHVLMADWRDVAALRYFIARDKISQVGKGICQLLKTFMTLVNVTSNQIHVIGHSLGAHVGTHVGRCYKSSDNERWTNCVCAFP